MFENFRKFLNSPSNGGFFSRPSSLILLFTPVGVPAVANAILDRRPHHGTFWATAMSLLAYALYWVGVGWIMGLYL